MERIGSRRRVFCKPKNTGSVRSAVANPRSLNFTSGRPESSSGFGLPISERSAPAVEHAHHVAGLRNFPTGEGIQVGKDTFGMRLILRRRRKRQQPLRDTV